MRSPNVGADMARRAPSPEREGTAETPTAPAKPGADTTRRAKMAGWVTDPASGWDARLWRLWALYTALAYTVILAVIAATASFGFDVTVIAVNHRVIGTLLIATAGAALYGAVLGRLQWRVLRQRIPVRRRSWISACIIPALVVWGSVVVPAAISADTSGHNLRVAYLLAVSQALALGPLIGFAQARALKPYSKRWKWWIAANIVSYLVVYALFYLISIVFGGFDFIEGEGTPLEAYIVLISTTPISGRWLLWVTAPAACRADAPE